MIPHISFTEMVQVAALIFVIGFVAGGWAIYKLGRK